MDLIFIDFSTHPIVAIKIRKESGLGWNLRSALLFTFIFVLRIRLWGRVNGSAPIVVGGGMKYNWKMVFVWGEHATAIWEEGRFMRMKKGAQ